MSFREIAFKAELDRHMDPECEHLALRNCGEDPRTRSAIIKELRNMIYERGQCQPPRTDDEFLLRFLRVRRFIPARAHRLLVRYCQFREQNPNLWRDVYWYDLSKLGDIFGGVLFDRPDVGRLIICRLGLWDPNTVPAEDILRGCLLLLEVGVRQPKLQVLGGTTLLDCEGLSFKHMMYFTPSIANQAMNVMGLAFPIYQRGLHVVNCSPTIERLFYMFRRLAPSDELWNQVHFHRNDLSSLHRYIDPECLPTRYKGLRETVSLSEWLTKIKLYKNKEFDEDLRNLGYAV